MDAGPPMSEGSSPPAPASLPDNDDILREILLRLPPLPSSLPRASLVSKRWRRLVSDPHLRRRFRAHHRTPPLLGFFAYYSGKLAFTPTLDRPDRIPPARFSLARRPGQRLCFVGCRHGLALLLDWALLEAVVWDPVTGRQQCVSFPAQFKVDIENHFYNGAVLSSANHDGDDCYFIRFKLVLVRTNVQDLLASACLYESQSGEWGNISSTAISSSNLFQSSVLVGNAIHWLLSTSSDILEFDLDRQALAVIQKPASIRSTCLSSFQVLRAENDRLGLAILSELTIQLWERKEYIDGVVGWLLWRTVDLDKLLSLTPENTCPATISGFDEDNNVIFLSTLVDFFMIELKSMQFTRLLKDNVIFSCYPYTSFCLAGPWSFLPTLYS